MYWVWANESTSDDEAMIYGPTDFSEEEEIDFDTGFAAILEGSLNEITRGEQSQGRLSDNVYLRGTGGQMFSPKLRRALDELGVDNIQYFPVILRNMVDGTAISDYCIANIVGRIECLDLERSVVDRSEDDEEEGVIEVIEALAIDESRIVEGFSLFRLHEDPDIILASDRVRRACERHGITGVRFYKPEEWEP